MNNKREMLPLLLTDSPGACSGSCAPKTEFLSVDGVPVCVVRQGDELRGFISICSHKNLIMRDVPFDGEVLYCPFHHVSFDAVSGQVVDSRGKRVPEGLRPVAISQNANGEVKVRLSDRDRRYVRASQARRLVAAALKTMKRTARLFSR